MSNKNKHLKGVVYSTNPDFVYEDLRQEKPQALGTKQQRLRVRIEKNHRGGKTVTVVDGFVGSENEMQELGKLLKQHCGVGGSVKDNLILIQGAQKERVVKMLVTMGYDAK